MKNSHPLPDAVVIELITAGCLVSLTCVMNFNFLFGWVVEESHFQN